MHASPPARDPPPIDRLASHYSYYYLDRSLAALRANLKRRPPVTDRINPKLPAVVCWADRYFACSPTYLGTETFADPSTTPRAGGPALAVSVARGLAGPPGRGVRRRAPGGGAVAAGARSRGACAARVVACWCFVARGRAAHGHASWGPEPDPGARRRRRRRCGGGHAVLRRWP